MDRERPPPPPPETHRVVILGGGVAGLACARYLLGGSLPDAPPEAEADESDAAAAEPPLAQGRNSNDKQKKKACEVVILEAADRLGGRLWTRTFAGAKVDAGAAWVHGTVGSPLTTIAAMAGIALPATVPSNPWMDPTVGLRDSQYRLSSGAATGETTRVLSAAEVAEGNRCADEFFDDVESLAREHLANRNHQRQPRTNDNGSNINDDDNDNNNNGNNRGSVPPYALSDAAGVVVSRAKYRDAPPNVRAFLEIRLRLVEWWMGASLTEISLDDWGGDEEEDKGGGADDPVAIHKVGAAAAAEANAAGGETIVGGGFGDFPGPHCLPEGGMEQFSRWLADDGALQRCVRLGREAKAVEWQRTAGAVGGAVAGAAGAAAAAAAGAGPAGLVRPCCVTAATGERFEADSVVVTLPVGVLKHQNNYYGGPGGGGGGEFDGSDESLPMPPVPPAVPAADVLLQPGVRFLPPLPPAKRKAIGSLACATYKKVWLEFAPEEVFWDRHAPLFVCADPLPHRPFGGKRAPPTAGEPRAAMESSAGGGGGSAASASTSSSASSKLHARRFADEAAVASAPHESLPPMHFMLLDNLLHAKGVPCLEAIFAGDEGVALLGLPDADIRDITLARLRLSFPAPAYTVPEPRRCFVTRWEEDPLSRGAYSFLPRGAGGSVEQLAAPVKAPVRTGGGVHRRGAQEEEEEVEEEEVERVFFAGEATDADYQGCVHAAYLSGIRAAQEILKCHGVAPSSSSAASSSSSSSSAAPSDGGNGGAQPHQHQHQHQPLQMQQQQGDGTGGGFATATTTTTTAAFDDAVTWRATAASAPHQQRQQQPAGSRSSRL